MKECLREDVLQSYLDGELHPHSMEQVSLHLATCAACGELARQFESENNLITSALAPEFETVVPSERLRSRIDSAIAANRFESAPGTAANVRNWLSSISDLFTFRPQQAFVYASLMLIVGFGLIMGIVRWQATPAVPTSEVATNDPAPAPVAPPAAVQNSNNAAPVSNVSTAPTEVSNAGTTAVAKYRQPRNVARPQTPRTEVAAANHVKLLPGERSYLQTIAQLDSTIKAEKSRMKPGVQAEYQRNLAFVDRNLAVARTAAKSNPNDPDATEFMFSAYQTKVDLLNTVAEARVIDK